LLVSLALSVTTAAQGPTASPPRVLAEVGGRTVLSAEFEATRLEERRRAVAANQLNALTTTAKEQTLERLIDARRFALEARARKLDQRPDIARQIENAIDTVLSEALAHEIAAATPTDDAALRRYYDAHVDAYREVPRVRARHVVVRSEAEAFAILGKLRRHADFAALAREHNVDSTRESGGDLGWVRRGAMVPAFEQALFGLRPGEVSQPIRTPYGFHLVQAIEIEPARTKPFATVADDVRAKVILEAVAAARAELAKKHPARIDAAALKAAR
jgi:peptidyl-prolyl cis-trans isomerase C